MKLLQDFYLQLNHLSSEIQPFDTELEAVYQADLREQFYEQIKLAVIVGTLIHFSFIGWDMTNLDIAPNAWIWRFPSLIIGYLIWRYMEKYPEFAKRHLFNISFSLIILAAIFLFVALINANNAEYYARFYPAFLLVFAYLYGPLLMTLKPSFIFCMLITIIMIVLGILFCVKQGQLVGAIYTLFFMSIIGAYSKYQIEVFSRRSFLDKKNAKEKQLMAEKAIAERDIFLRNASHNLSQPIQALTCYAGTLEHALRTQNLNQIQDRAEDFVRLVDLLSDSFNKIMDISKIHSGVYKPMLKQVAIDQILTRIQKQYIALANEKQITLEVIKPKDKVLLAYTDANMLQQVISNLVHNAIKCTDKGSVSISATTNGNQIHIHIKDTGIGISKEQQQEIFKPFYKINEEADGSGIGLNFVKEAINNLPNHQLSVESEINVGSTFCITMPVVEQQDMNADFAVTRYNKSSDTRSSTFNLILTDKFILVIDDNKDVRNALSEQLKHQGANIEKAASVAEAKQILESYLQAPNLIITDYKLGNTETAEDIVRCVQTIYQQRTPIIVITGEPFTGKTINILGNDYSLLKKPLNNTQLLQAITNALRDF